MIASMRKRFTVRKDSSGKPQLYVEEEDIEYIANILEEVSSGDDTTLDAIDSYRLKLMTECYRALRNCCIAGRCIQRSIVDSDAIERATAIDYERVIRSSIVSNDKRPLDHARETELSTFIKTLFGYMVNLTVGNATVAAIVYYRRCAQFLNLLRGTSLINETCAILHNVLVNCNDSDSVHLSDELIDAIFDVYEKEAKKENESGWEYLSFVIDDFATRPLLYLRLDSRKRTIALRQLTAYRYEQGDKTGGLTIDTALVTLLCEDFKRKSDRILKTVTHYMENDFQAEEVALLLEVLSFISGDDDDMERLKAVQNDKCLLINCVFLLRSIHAVGKESNNHFSAIQKLGAGAESWKAEELCKEHPGYGFKGNLIRLLGNMCWRCERNQNKLRQLKAIPLILDSCNMDVRNPFIIQWCVWAIRNLCEDNSANRDLIASMTRLGTIQNSTLAEMGLALTDDEENKIRVIPLDSVKHRSK